MAPVLIDEGIDRPRVISPHDIWRSIAYMRVNTSGDIKMPPLARETIDQQGVHLLHDWITSMPGAFRTGAAGDLAARRHLSFTCRDCIDADANPGPTSAIPWTAARRTSRTYATRSRSN